MRRVRFHAHGGPGVLAVEETAVPEPGPGQVLIRAEAIGVNYVDVQIRRETSPESIWFRPLPGTLTGDVVGTVAETGPGADPALAGTRVAVLLEDACADYVLADTGWLVSVPDDLDAGAASLLPTVAPVALGVLRAARPASGETILVSSAAGAIGHLAVQLARRAGAGTVIATAGSAAKLALAGELGADAAIDYTGPDWAAQARAAAPGGIDVILDAVGGATLHQSIDLLAPGGRLVVYGASAGDLTSVPVRSLFALRTMTGFSLLAWRAARPEQARADIAELTGLLADGSLRAVTGTRIPLAEVARAHRLLEDRAVLGRVILVP
ncbi:MAG: quinone oxidoreductase family protein [Micromonosporaceae bacterium]